MKTIKKLVIATLILLSGPIILNAKLLPENRYVINTKAMQASYNSIEALGSIEIILVQGTSNSLTIEGYQDEINSIDFKVENNTLFVSNINNNGIEKVKVYVPLNTLSYLKVEGNIIVKSLGTISTNNLVVDVAGECHVSIKATEINTL
jgi:hypothetical protein